MTTAGFDDLADDVDRLADTARVDLLKRDAFAAPLRAPAPLAARPPEARRTARSPH